MFLLGLRGRRSRRMGTGAFAEKLWEWVQGLERCGIKL
jgi:hypothetical protein